MKIFFVINMLSNGGAERVTSRLCSFWSTDNEVLVFQTSFNKQPDDYKMDEKVKFVNPCKDKRISRLKLIKELRKNIKSYNPDVVVSFLDTGHFYTFLALRWLKIPHICSERNDPFNSPKSKILKLMRKIAFNHCSAIVFQTHGARDYFPAKIRNKGIIIPNPLLTEQKFQDTNREECLIAAGRLEPQKNYFLLIKAFEVVLERFPNYKLKIFGKGSLSNELQSYIDKSNLNNSVFLCGFTTNIIDEYKKSSIYVMSSLHEGLPNSLMEAISCGTPSISTDANPGGPKWIISQCSGSVLVKNNDVDSLSSALINMITNYSKYYNEAQNDAKNFIKNYSIDIIGNKWIELFKKVIDKNAN